MLQVVCLTRFHGKFLHIQDSHHSDTRTALANAPAARWRMLRGSFVNLQLGHVDLLVFFRLCRHPHLARISTQSPFRKAVVMPVVESVWRAQYADEVGSALRAGTGPLEVGAKRRNAAEAQEEASSRQFVGRLVWIGTLL
jgi:hypothetical protein